MAAEDEKSSKAGEPKKMKTTSVSLEGEMDKITEVLKSIPERLAKGLDEQRTSAFLSGGDDDVPQPVPNVLARRLAIDLKNLHLRPPQSQAAELEMKAIVDATPQSTDEPTKVIKISLSPSSDTEADNSDESKSTIPPSQSEQSSSGAAQQIQSAQLPATERDSSTFSKIPPCQPDQSSNAAALQMQPAHQPIAINDRSILSEIHPCQSDLNSNAAILQMQPERQPTANDDRSILSEVPPNQPEQSGGGAALQMILPNQAEQSAKGAALQIQ
ncbi:unnamed protein product [Haemonchus placei]|uniref:Uncharacterized protein n=1 Tax=Haemonchus placei TaxID=6290 RepID=A0A0N4WVQ0_HAEPC|nr:unnamed protein product [Haemonchus placei]